jgi:hypothetical protein
MELLRDRGLYGKGLFKLTSPTMVARYNSALEYMGLPKTSLQQFSVDMIGWSPEIADEQQNIYYLTQDIANPVAIIVNINQKHAPIYFPYHSFDRPMIDSFFDKYSDQIMDVNTLEALCIDLDNGVSVYTELGDLLMVTSFTMRVHTPNHIISAAKEQQALVKAYLEDENGWEDEELRQQLIQSGEKFGDLRDRDLIIPPLSYDDLKIYYTEAFGGVYILNDPPGAVARETIIIVKDEIHLPAKTARNSRIRYESVNDENLLRKLTGAKYFEFDLSCYLENPASLEEKKDIILAEFACKHETDFSNWGPFKKNNFIAQNADAIPALFFELEKLQKQLQSDMNVDISHLSDELIAFLTTVHKRIDPVYHYALNNLLATIAPHNPIMMYRYNKNEFYKEYSTYNECKKNWIVEHLNRNK